MGFSLRGCPPQVYNLIMEKFDIADVEKEILDLQSPVEKAMEILKQLHDDKCMFLLLNCHARPMFTLDDKCVIFILELSRPANIHPR